MIGFILCQTCAKSGSLLSSFTIESNRLYFNIRLSQLNFKRDDPELSQAKVAIQVIKRKHNMIH
jgi:hypothetical protein